MRNLKLSALIAAIAIVTAIFFVSCSKDENEPIALHYVENNSIDMVLYPDANKQSISIIGGDGNYSASCNNNAILEVELVQEKNMILLKPLSTGDAIVTITDKSGNSYILNVKVYYKEINMTVDKQEVIVIGDKLSKSQKVEIQQKALLTLLVKVNGGFKFVYNDSEQTYKGEAFIYKEKFGGAAVECIFEEKRMEVEANGFIQNYTVFVITIDGKKREFVMNKYTAIKSRGDMMELMALNEVLTELFKTDYPDVELVYTQQRLQ